MSVLQLRSAYVHPATPYTTVVSTANGKIKAARTRIAMIDIGGLIVRDVDAMVLPDEALSENLLGLSFLSKLKRFEFSWQQACDGTVRRAPPP